MSTTRRQFIKNTSHLAMGIGVGRAVPAILGANDRIQVALIGCNNMGWNDLMSTLSHPNVNCIALCDVDSRVLHSRAAELEKQTGRKPLLYEDYRKLLENKEIDAVIIGTPDHWHCLQMIEACQAGKDVYVEKPIGHSIEECNLMVAAKNKYGRVVQVGQWQRSDPHWINALHYLHSGHLGKIRTAKTWGYVSYGKDFFEKPDGPSPPGVNYDMWLGPAPQRMFNPNRFHGTFRYFWDYAGGLMTDWGVHMIDMALAGMHATIPYSVASVGGKYGYPDSAAETPDTQHVQYDFGDFTMLWEQSLATGVDPYLQTYGEPGVAFVGNNGTLVINRNKWAVYPETNQGNIPMEIPPVQQNKTSGLQFHTLNFLECIRSRKQPNCSIEMGRDAAVTAMLGNIAYRLGEKICWDNEKNAVKDHSEARKMTKAKYRLPWKLPHV